MRWRGWARRSALKMIESYDFGRIVVDGKEYTSDLIIFPDHIETKWWRKKGHELGVEDVRAIVEAKPNILIVGTGFSGLMKVLSDTVGLLESKQIKLIAQDSEKAWQTYNQLHKSSRVIAAFHLTC